MSIRFNEICINEEICIYIYIYIYMLFPEPKKLLNNRNELMARCRHRAKFKL